jgi:hypothetical protein
METIDIYELSEWEAFWMIEGGFGDWKADMRSGQVCSVLANTSRNPKSTPRPFKIDDFDLRPKGPVDTTTDKSKAIKAGFDALAAIGPKKKKRKRTKCQ